MKKLLTAVLLSMAVLGLTLTTANAKCNGDQPKTEKPADKNETKGKCGAGKCGDGK